MTRARPPSQLRGEARSHAMLRVQSGKEKRVAAMPLMHTHTHTHKTGQWAPAGGGLLTMWR